MNKPNTQDGIERRGFSFWRRDGRKQGMSGKELAAYVDKHMNEQKKASNIPKYVEKRRSKQKMARSILKSGSAATIAPIHLLVDKEREIEPRFNLCKICGVPAIPGSNFCYQHDR